MAQFDRLQRQLDSRNDQIRNKRESNKRLERQNELIRKRGLDIISAINHRNPNLSLNDNEDQYLSNEHKQIQTKIGEANDQQIMQPTSPRSPTDQPLSPKMQETAMGEVDTLGIWIDMKCDETLDGLD